jgi:hypothetical protein
MSSVPLDPTPSRPRAVSLSCPSCGAGITPRAQGWAVTIVCDSCGAVLDATDPNLSVLQQQDARQRVKPRIPLGTRGTWHGAPWEVIGFQVVTINVDGVDYSWTEYVAFNPYRGFLYLSEYQGHWNVIEKLRRRPREEHAGSKPTATIDGRTFKHFQTATARTTLALGEFPWELRVGDAVIARDFIAPPYILSAEASDGETTWSLGTYTPPDVIAKAFNVPGAMMKPIGIFANQPNPYDGQPGVVGRRFGLFVLALIAMFLGNFVLASRADVYTGRYTFAKGTDDSAAFVTPAFELKGRPSSVDIDIDATVDNDWIFYSFALINAQSGESRELSQQVSYYYGTDSDGKWTEGSTHENVRIASVPSGRYFLRVAPEGGETGRGPVGYTLRVRRDVPSFLFYLVALAALVIPAILALLPKGAFETKRWQESDYAVESSSDSSDGDDE